MEYAGVGRRALAYIIDQMFVAILFACLLLGPSATGGTNEGATVVISVFAAVGMSAYWIILEGSNGATFGKQLVGIEVVKRDGSPMDLKSALIRQVLRIIDMLFSGLVGAFIIWTSLENQRLGDMAADTVVVLE